jgi:hypothetical protein
MNALSNGCKSDPKGRLTEFVPPSSLFRAAVEKRTLGGAFVFNFATLLSSLFPLNLLLNIMSVQLEPYDVLTFKRK